MVSISQSLGTSADTSPYHEGTKELVLFQFIYLIKNYLVHSTACQTQMEGHKNEQEFGICLGQ